MKNKYYIFGTILILLIAGTSCASKKSAVREDKSFKKFDEAAFDYVYVEALKQKLLGNGGDALRYLEQCVKLDPESDAAYYQMAQIVLASGDMVNGKKYARQAYRLDDKNLWYTMMLSGIYYQEGNIDSAIYIYEKASVYFSEKQNVKMALANLYTEKRDYGKAINIFKELELKYNINETTTPAYIHCLVLAGRFEEALSKTQEIIDNFPAEVEYYALMAEVYREKGDGVKAQEVYQKLLEENPDNPQIQISVCDFLITEKKYDDLFILLNPVILNTEIKREDKLALFARLIENKDITKENNDKVLLALMVLEATYKNDDIIPLLRPEFLDNINRDKEAINLLEGIIARMPGNYYAWERLLLLYMKSGDYKNLMIRGEECASKFNRSFLAKLLYANGALESGKYDTAIEELRKAEILAGDNKEYILQVLTMRADAYYRMKNYNKAFETFEEAINMNGDDITILNNYAYYLAEQNMELKKAEEMAVKVIEKEKDNATFLDTYAWVLYKRGKIKDAAKIMEKIISEGSETNAEYFEHYAFILKSLKKCDIAVEYWSRAIKLDSTKTELQEEIKNCTNR
ncbi:MAG TPA: tetratricopeptide repeat protein [Bacteroidales bacterium]|nr:tetratricopeptide repeat protein [Bacteroidales bacterium]